MSEHLTSDPNDQETELRFILPTKDLPTYVAALDVIASIDVLERGEAAGHSGLIKTKIRCLGNGLSLFIIVLTDHRLVETCQNLISRVSERTGRPLSDREQPHLLP